jgi:hypothetical protein
VAIKISDCNYSWHKCLPLDINIYILLIRGKPDLYVDVPNTYHKIKRLGADKFFNTNAVTCYTIISTVIINTTLD